jgi:hypothetical protein
MAKGEYGSLAKFYWQEVTEIFGATLATVQHLPPQWSYGLAWDGIRAFAVKGRQLTAWAFKDEDWPELYLPIQLVPNSKRTSYHW